MLKNGWKKQKMDWRIVMVMSFLIGVGIVLTLNSSALAQASDSKGSDSTAVVGVILGGLLGVVGGIVAAIVTSTQKIKELKEEFKLREKEQKRKEIAKLRRDYLNPLKLSAEELKDRLQELKYKQKKEDEARKTISWFNTVKDYTIRKGRDNEEFKFAEWSNGEGYFAVSTLYLTLAYFAAATRIREEMPFTILVPEYNEYIQKITHHTEKIRKDFGGLYGIWEEIQDSMGRIGLQSDDSIMDYKQFYSAILDETTCSGFINMADYYRNFQGRENLQSIIDSLEALITEYSQDGELYKELIEA
jgi:gas vesicle protein